MQRDKNTYLTASPDDPALEKNYKHVTCLFIGEGNNARNPFTDRPLTTYQTEPVDLNLLYLMKWDVSENNGNRFLEAEWYQVYDNIYDIRNWQYTVYR